MEIKLQEYSIHIDSLAAPLLEYFESHSTSKVFVLVDENTKEHCLPSLNFEGMPDFQIIEIKAGEQFKNIDSCQLIWQRLLESAADRKALLINLGGGVIGDMGGFCAATFKRGIPFIQIPTTLLSQVDASVGGKLGIDFQEVKNSIGLFQNPEMVLLQPDFLKTLPSAELRSGFAEVIKHALIQDKDQWDEIEKIENLSAIEWKNWIARSVIIKKNIVVVDPFEKGERKKLNFGHTVGHAIESFFLNTESPLLHGEAIAWGMLAEAKLSQVFANLSDKHFQGIFDLIERLYQPKPITETIMPELVKSMKNDKKNSFGKINFTMLKEPGTSFINQDIAEQSIIKAILEVNQQLSS